MKCLRALVPWEVAEAGGEAAPDQEMAHLLLAEELCGISRSEELRPFPLGTGVGTVPLRSPRARAAR